MHNEFEHIPEHILSLMEQVPFTQLSTPQQQDVLQWMTEAEYTELHVAAQALHTTSFAEEEPAKHVEQQLLGQFDRLYPRRKKRILHLNIPLWAVAASWLLLIGAGLLLSRKPQSESNGLLTTIHDTIRVEQPARVIEQLVHDTVYLIQTVKAGIAPETHVPSPPPVAETRLAVNDSGNAEAPLQLSGIRVLSIHDLDMPPNNKTGKPIENDSLLRQFETARLL